MRDGRGTRPIEMKWRAASSARPYSLDMYSYLFMGKRSKDPLDLSDERV
jgi:hypothetical protein